MATYINISDRYGDPEAVTLADYQEITPDGQFEERSDGIYELVDPMHRTAGRDESYNESQYQWLKIAELKDS